MTARRNEEAKINCKVIICKQTVKRQFTVSYDMLEKINFLLLQTDK